MHKSGDAIGRWNDNNCQSIKSYYCGKNQDPSIQDGQEINANRNCPSGWNQFDIKDGENVCFYFSSAQNTFNGASQYCQDQGGELASFQGLHEQHFVTSLSKSTSVWIGMKMDPANLVWSWIDGWPVWFSNWGEGSPGSPDVSKSCVLNKDGSVGSEWIPASCEESHPFICKTASQTVPTTPPYIEGYCVNPTWHIRGGFCYFYNMPLGNEEQNPGRTWQEAEAHCNAEFGNLVSFADRAEYEWMLSWYNNTEPVWIGLNQNGNGGFAWTSSRPVTYTNWNVGEPNSFEGREDCVEMAGEDGTWNDNNCARTFGYICRVPKIIDTDDDGKPVYHTTPQPSIDDGGGSSNAGAIVGIIIAVIVVIVLIVVAFKYFKDSAPVSKITSVAEGASGFVNKLYTGGSGQTTQSNQNPDTTIHFDQSMDSES